MVILMLQTLLHYGYVFLITMIIVYPILYAIVLLGNFIYRENERMGDNKSNNKSDNKRGIDRGIDRGKNSVKNKGKNL